MTCILSKFTRNARKIKTESVQGGIAINPKIQQIERLKGLAQQIDEIADKLVEMPRNGGHSFQTRKVELESLGVKRQAYAIGLLYHTKMTVEEVGVEVGATRQTIHNWKRARWQNKTR